MHSAPWLQGAHNLEEVIIALQTGFAFMCEALVITLTGHGGLLDDLPFHWALELADDASRDLWQAYVGELESLSDAFADELCHHSDLCGQLYAEMLPREVRHALGEFYTPRWLAAQLIDDLQLEGPTRVVDPFCGSGVFLLAALDAQISAGQPPAMACANVFGADINPAACVAARGNLALAWHRHGISSEHRPRQWPVWWSDSLQPALSRAHDGARQTVDAPLWQRAPFDVVATNPPWVGWEYQSRALRTAVQPAWDHYALSSSRGTARAFLKEDLSTLAMVATWDTLLAEGGRSVAVLRSSTMTSSVASSGLRRLSIHPEAAAVDQMALEHVHVLDDLRVFHGARVEACAWMLTKGAPTTFPVPGQIWQRKHSSAHPSPWAPLSEVLDHVHLTPAAVTPTDPQRQADRWMVGARRCVELSAEMSGVCAYRGRAGVFTGGANAVYYLERQGPHAPGCSRYTNIVKRSRRPAPKISAILEDAWVYEIIRGRDVQRWHTSGHSLLLCPHTADTRLHAIDPTALGQIAPHALAYLTSMRATLDARKGFTRWEQPYREQAFYVLQRIGAYTFAPYKVCWRYIATDFVVAVVGPDALGRPRLPNDKVMSVGVASIEEAHYLCGVLSSSPVRWRVLAHSSGKQISASAISSIKVPRYDADDTLHRRIAAISLEGHGQITTASSSARAEWAWALDALIADMFQWPVEHIDTFRDDLHRWGLTF